MQFYLPNFEDLVDPDYDFENDTYSKERDKNGRFHHDKYAHEFYLEPIFDGMLVSKTVVKQSVEKRIQASGDVHTFFRLGKQIPIMGDCGAFSYLNDKNPPYTVPEILNYYETLGFTYGVALDHLVFPTMPEEERERRLKITLDNAQEFLYKRNAGNYKVIPVGIVQGWDAESRRDTVWQLLDMGYDHLAIGGMARSKDREITQTLQAIHPLVQENERVKMLHLFGVARLSLIPEFIRYGVTSADSASPIRRAFLGTGEDNYWAIDGQKYAAIRVPEVKEGATKKRGIDSIEEIQKRNGISLGFMQQMEQKALRLLRAFDQGKANLEDTLATVLEYDRLHGDKRNHEKAYRRTLTERPWQKCGCPVCQKYGIEVIIFRGNNRNRRRGFHNVGVFYKMFHDTVSINRGLISDSTRETWSYQPTLGFDNE